MDIFSLLHLAIAKDSSALALTTGHALSVPQAIERIIDLFPPHERHLVQLQLASLIVIQGYFSPLVLLTLVYSAQFLLTASILEIIIVPR